LHIGCLGKIFVCCCCSFGIQYSSPPPKKNHVRCACYLIITETHCIQRVLKRFYYLMVCLLRDGTTVLSNKYFLPGSKNRTSTIYCSFQYRMLHVYWTVFVPYGQYRMFYV
jgi:hypothetical protein